MNNLYVIGGPPRCGKSTILYELMKQKPVVAVQFDAVRDGVRNALFDETNVEVTKLHLKGGVTFKKEDGASASKAISIGITEEDPFVWKALTGIVKYYDKDLDTQDLALEGTGITPTLASRLKPANYVIRAAFVGFTDAAHSEAILAHARDKEDWIHTWLKQNQGDEAEVRAWINSEVERSKREAKEVAELGYGYFDLSKRPFEDHVKTAVEYLLEPTKSSPK